MNDLGDGLRRFAMIVDELPSVVVTAGANGRIAYLSRRWYEITAHPPDSLEPEQAFLNAIPSPERGEFEHRWWRGIMSGAEFTVLVRVATLDGERTFELRARPIPARARARIKWVGTLSDVEQAVTATRAISQVKQRFEILAETGRVFNSARTLAEIADGLYDLRGAEQGDRWFVEIRESSTGSALRRGLIAFERELIATALQEGDAETAVVERSNNGANVLFVAASLFGLSTASGFVGFVRENGMVATLEDRVLVAEVANRANIAIARIVSHRHDYEVARMLQRAMLPVALPSAPGLRLDVAYEPAEREALVGGDWYDSFELPDGRICLSIGDVAGHGFDAAIVMSGVRQSMRGTAQEGADPSTVLASANRLIMAQEQPMVTALFAILDPLSLALTYASAGHLPPLVVREDGTVRELACEGIPLGVDERQACVTCIEELSPGGALVLYTDGVVEDQKDLVFGESRLHEILSRWATNGFRARAAEIQASMRSGRRDDAAMLIIRFPHVDELTIRLPATPMNAQRLRLGVRRFIAGSFFTEDRAFDAVLAVGEAINNAVEHAYAGGEGFVQVEMRRETNGVVLEVHDEGSWRGTSSADRGRGMALMRHFADKVDILKGPNGTTVRLEVASAAAREGLIAGV